MTAPLYLVDASIYIFRAYFSMPDTFVAKNGEVVNAVYGYTSFVLDLLERQPEYISFAFDESLNTCYRNRIFPDYKANRDLPDENLEFQLQQCQEVTRLCGLHHLSLYDYEADDIIGTLQSKLAADRPVTIVTRDKDLGQLLRDDDQLWDFAADIFMGPSEVEDKFGVRPHQIADFLALAGDSVDNIPGAPGIGAKTAARLLQHFGDIASIFDRLDEVKETGIRGALKIQQTLIDYRDDIDIYRQITPINRAIDMQVELAELVRSEADTAGLMSLCEELKFGQRVTDRLAAL